MKKNYFIQLLVVISCFLMTNPLSPLFAINVPNPDEITVLSLVSFGEDGAAWLKLGDKEFLVTAGYLITHDLRVVAIRSDSVVLYRSLERKYFVLPLTTEETSWKLRNHLIWSYAMPLWKVVRMVAIAYRKDYICHFETRFEIAPRVQVANMNQMMAHVVSPNYRYHGRDGILYVAPVNMYGKSWTWFLDQVRKFNSEDLIKRFPPLAEKGTLICDGRNLQSVLINISRRSRVPIRWNVPIPFSIYCSFKDRPWHQIIENIVLYNGLTLTPTSEGLMVTPVIE